MRHRWRGAAACPCLCSCADACTRAVTSANSCRLYSALVRGPTASRWLSVRAVLPVDADLLPASRINGNARPRPGPALRHCNVPLVLHVLRLRCMDPDVWGSGCVWGRNCRMVVDLMPSWLTAPVAGVRRTASFGLAQCAETATFDRVFRPTRTQDRSR